MRPARASHRHLLHRREFVLLAADGPVELRRHLYNSRCPSLAGFAQRSRNACISRGVIGVKPRAIAMSWRRISNASHPRVPTPYFGIVGAAMAVAPTIFAAFATCTKAMTFPARLVGMSMVTVPLFFPARSTVANARTTLK